MPNISLRLHGRYLRFGILSHALTRDSSRGEILRLLYAYVVGAFPDGNSALMLVCARLRHVAGTQWGSKKYMNMKHLEAMEQEPQVG